MRHPNAFPRQRSCRFRGIERPEKCPVDIFQQDGAGRPAVGGFPGKCLHCSGKDGRGRSLGGKRANRRYRRGTDLFRPGLAAGPPSPASALAPGEGFWSHQPLFLIPNPYSLIPEPQLDKSEVIYHYITSCNPTQRLMGQFYVYLSTIPEIVL